MLSFQEHVSDKILGKSTKIYMTGCHKKNRDLENMLSIDLLELYFSQFQGTIKIHLHGTEGKNNNWKSFRILCGIKISNLLLNKISL